MTKEPLNTADKTSNWNAIVCNVWNESFRPKLGVIGTINKHVCCSEAGQSDKTVSQTSGGCSLVSMLNFKGKNKRFGIFSG